MAQFINIHDRSSKYKLSTELQIESVVFNDSLIVEAIVVSKQEIEKIPSKLNVQNVGKTIYFHINEYHFSVYTK